MTSTEQTMTNAKYLFFFSCLFPNFVCSTSRW